MNTFIVIIYIVLMVIFLIMSTLIIRHAIKYSYLSPRFKKIVAAFGLLAVSVIILSLYLLINLLGTPNSSPKPSSGSTTIPGNINF